jgi:hypothetical protein
MNFTYRAGTALPRLSASIRRPAQRHCRRTYAVQAPGAPRFQVFNRRTKWMQKERAASDVEESRQTDYLKDEVATRLSERLLVRRLAYGFAMPSTRELTIVGHQPALPQSLGLWRQLVQSRPRPGSRES